MRQVPGAADERPRARTGRRRSGAGDHGPRSGPQRVRRRWSGGGPDTSVVVVGLGNPILSDDAVGLAALREARRRLAADPAANRAAAAGEIVFVEAAVGGLELLDLLSGHKAAVLIDAVVTGKARPGEVVELDPSFLGDLEDTGRLGTTGLTHQVDLGTAWRLGKRLGLPLPETVRVLGVEAADVKTFSEELTPAVAARLPSVVDTLLRVIAEVGGESLCMSSPCSKPCSTR